MSGGKEDSKASQESLTSSWGEKRVAGQRTEFNPGLPFCTSNIVAVPVLERGVLYCLSFASFFSAAQIRKSQSEDYFRLLEPLNCDSWGRVRREGYLALCSWVGI
jgi:hypothetical protein